MTEQTTATLGPGVLQFFQKMRELAKSFIPRIRFVEEFPQEEIGKTFLYVCHLDWPETTDEGPILGFQWVHGLPEQKQQVSSSSTDAKELQGNQRVHQHHVSLDDLKKLKFPYDVNCSIDRKESCNMLGEVVMAILECVRTSTNSDKVYFLCDPNPLGKIPGIARVFISGKIPQPV
jgi:hypothetical protein